ncbi:rod shape-determining protein MreD [Neisseria leonii]|uniref:rod shape-determining protein MreD n=1 Tax=Neisseria leonii TaxID=2995413 RepID=UPI00237B1DBB|nr:rod shape-determining protein MreD [Neisseria sp. 3986]MDD9326397.1 rod shape-determining protein MreD [Neisseria sp. 3986]
MTDFEDFYGRIPKSLIIGSLAFAMLLDFIPLPQDLFFWLPDLTALVLLYWAINRPRTIGIGTAFVCGLLIDAGTAAPLGMHALAYMAMIFVTQQYQRQIRLHSYDFQAVSVLAALAGSQAVLMLVRLFDSHRLGGWLNFTGALTGALLWPLLNKIMLLILNLISQRR